jgi:hypothetical protein
MNTLSRTALILGLSTTVALTASDALAQVAPNRPFCLSPNCTAGDSSAVTYAAAALPVARGGDWATTIWPRGLARVSDGSAHAIYPNLLAAEPAAGNRGVPLALANGLFPSSLASMPFAMGLHGPTGRLLAAALSRPRGMQPVLSISAAGNPFNLSGDFSDPAIACTEIGCLLALADNANGVTLADAFLGAGTNVRRVPAGQVGARASRPAVVALGGPQFAVVHHIHNRASNEANGLRILHVAFDSMTRQVVPAVIGDVPLPANLAGFYGSIAATLTNANYLLIAATYATNAENRLQLLTVRYPFAFPLNVANAVELILPVRSSAFVGLARSRESIVLTVQAQFVIASEPLWINPANGEIAIRIPNIALPINQAATHPVIAHSLTDGPLAFAAFDTYVFGRVVDRQAYGSLVATCLDNSPGQCQLQSESRRYCGTCENFDCVRWVDCGPAPVADAGVRDASITTADASIPDVPVSDSALVDAGAQTDAADDFGPTTDGTAVDGDTDTGERDGGTSGSDATADTVQTIDAPPSNNRIELQFGGGSCQCRAPHRSSATDHRWFAMALAAATASVRGSRRRRAARRA